MKKNILYLSILFVVFAILYFVVGPITKPVTLEKCEDDYADTDVGSAEYLADFDKWTNDFYDNNPGATLTDWSKARYDYWVKNNCQVAIARYNEAKVGKADPEVMEKIDNGIQKALNSN
jgi:hypothetical protein